MKKVKIVVIVNLCIFALGFLYRQIVIAKAPPNITISIDNMELDYVVGLNQWNGAKYDRLDTFNTIFIETTVNDFPYINLGSKVTIDFGMIVPSKVTITEEILEYTDNRFLPIENRNIEAKQKNRRISFDINKFSILGVNSYVTEDGYNIRGFRVIARWGQNECEYAFIIKTD